MLSTQCDMYRVSVLDGGFPAWQKGSYPVEATTVLRQDADATARAAREHAGQPSFRAELRVRAHACHAVFMKLLYMQN